LLSTTRGSGRGEMKVGATLDAVESGRGIGAFIGPRWEGEWPGCEGEQRPSVELQSFGFKRRRDGVASVAGGEEDEALWRLGSHAPEVARGERA
jgi:hypothetical protein